MKKMFVSALLLAVLPASAASQTPEERIQQAIVRAQTAGVPVALLESKIAEGRAKGVDLSRLALAIERRAEGLARAKAALANRGGPVDDATLVVGADALNAGVSEAVLQALSDAAPADRRAVAVAALTELVNNGHVPAEALARVKEALARGPEALENLPAEAARGRARGDAAGSKRPTTAGVPKTIPAPGAAPAAGAPSNVPKPPRPTPRRPGS